MTIFLPPGYHWAPTAVRPSIMRRGLKPTTATAVWHRPVGYGHRGHITVDSEPDALLAVCLGTTPSTAWSLSGAINADRGESYDLWEVWLADDDEIHVRPQMGYGIDEVRVIGHIPKARCWYVGTREVRASGSRWYAG